MTKTIGPKEAALKAQRESIAKAKAKPTSKAVEATKMVKLATAVAAINANGADKAVAKANAAEDALPPFLDRKVNGVKPANAEPKPEATATAAPAERPFDPYAKEHAELKKAKAHGRIAKMKAKQSGDAAKMPLTGKAALAAIKEVKPEHSATAKTKESDVRTKKATNKARSKISDKTKANTELLISALKRKNGVDNAGLVEVLGARMSAATMRRACETHELKLKIVKKEGEPTRYMIA